MKFPIALVAAVLIWSATKHLPPYFLEMRKMDLAEQQLQMMGERQMALLREYRVHLQAQTRAQAGESDLEKRFY